MRKWSTVILVLVILAALFFAFSTRRHPPAQQKITRERAIIGIGVMLGMYRNALEIEGVLPDSPAAKAGLHRGMVIQQIDGVSVAGKPLKESVAMTRGPAGSKVQIEVTDATGNETKTVEVTRAEITLPAGHETIKVSPVAH